MTVDCRNPDISVRSSSPLVTVRWRRVAGLLAGLLVALALPMSAFARQQVVAVLPPTGDNVAPELLTAAHDILEDNLQRTGAYSVVDAPAAMAGPAPTGQPPATSGATPIEPTAADAAQRARAAGAELAIVLRLTHFGSSARLRLTAYAAGTGQVAYWDSILIVGGPDELDTAIARLVHGMQVGKPVRESAEIDTVTGKESQTLNRREANKSFGVHLFTLLPFNTAGGSFSALPSGGIYWLYDARSWMADLAFDLGGHDSNSLVDATIGAYYPFLREDFTPYVGGVVRWARMELGGQGASGLSFQPTAGLLLGRLSSVQLRAEVGYFFNTFGERESQTSNAQPPLHYSNGFVVSMGIGF